MLQSSPLSLSQASLSPACTENKNNKRRHGGEEVPTATSEKERTCQDTKYAKRKRSGPYLS